VTHPGSALPRRRNAVSDPGRSGQREGRIRGFDRRGRGRAARAGEGADLVVELIRSL
jgi:hypothetical protein